MLNTILKLNLKKATKLFFVEKMRPKLMVSESQKKLQVLEKSFFSKKKILPAYLCGYDLQNASSIDIGGIRTVFVLYFFMKDI